MYLNNVTLTGFLGGDADTRTTKNNTNFTAFSFATKNSWKDRATGEWASRTEWHRAIVVRSADCLRRHSQEGRTRPDPRTTPHSRVHQRRSQEDRHGNSGHVHLETRPEPQAATGCPRRNAGGGLMTVPARRACARRGLSSVLSASDRKHRMAKTAKRCFKSHPCRFPQKSSFLS